jgi:hypothetical protein
LFWLLSMELIPAPGEAEAVTLEVVGAGEVVLNPEGNVQVARDDPQTGEGPGGALFTISESVALFPVSSVPIKRLLVVFVYVPVARIVTFTLIVQVLFAAMLPFENEMDPAPATGANVGEPQPDVEAFGVLATTIAPGVIGKVSVKFSPLKDEGVGLVIVNVRVETPPTFVGSGLKFLEIVTAEGLRI